MAAGDLSARPSRMMRRDARERRDALLRAAIQCFGESGYHVPLEEIADRAGVGRGTLYRNFKDRTALVVAIFDREVERLEEAFDPDVPMEQAIARLVRERRSMSQLLIRLKMDMPIDAEMRPAYEALNQRVLRVLGRTVDRAKANGEVRADLGPEHVLLSVRMISAIACGPVDDAQAEQLIASAIDLLLRGMRPR